MTPGEKQRMIHIRLDRKVHKELRKAAAEYDVSIQEIVSEAVEKRVEALETEISVEERSDGYKLEITESIEVGSSSRASEEPAFVHSHITERLTEIETAIAGITDRIAEIRKMLSKHE